MIGEAEFAKSKIETIKAQRQAFLGKEYVDLRVFKLGPDGKYFPTPKGLKFKPEQAAEVIRLIQQVTHD